MAEFRDFMYIRIDPDPVDRAPSNPRRLKASDLAITRTHLKKARRKCFEVHRRDAVTERVSAAVAASGRPKFRELLRKLPRGTALVVPELDCLGRDATDVLRTIREVVALGLSVYCMSMDVDKLSDDETALSTLEHVAKLEHRVATGRSATDRRGLGVAGGRIGRPPSLDDATRAKVRKELAAGQTVSDLARRYNTSRQTILRVRDAER